MNPAPPVRRIFIWPEEDTTEALQNRTSTDQPRGLAKLEAISPDKERAEGIRTGAHAAAHHRSGGLSLRKVS